MTRATIKKPQAKIYAYAAFLYEGNIKVDQIISYTQRKVEGSARNYLTKPKGRRVSRIEISYHEQNKPAKLLKIIHRNGHVEVLATQEEDHDTES